MCKQCCKDDSRYYDAFERIIAGYDGSETELIPLLQRLQEAYGYLPEDIIEKVSERSGIFASKIIGVVTFYSQFRTQPAGESVIKICFGTACHVNGAEKIAEALSGELGIPVGSTTQDNKFTLETVACLGCCSLAPVMMINDEVYGRLTPESARKTIRELRERGGTD